jgi:hypothetical protein
MASLSEQRYSCSVSCSHRAAGLCDACLRDYLEDPIAWLEYGDHPAGRANWERLRAEMGRGRPLEPAFLDDADLPF